MRNSYLGMKFKSKKNVLLNLGLYLRMVTFDIITFYFPLHVSSSHVSKFFILASRISAWRSQKANIESTPIFTVLERAKYILWFPWQLNFPPLFPCFWRFVDLCIVPVFMWRHETLPGGAVVIDIGQLHRIYTDQTKPFQKVRRNVYRLEYFQL